MKIVSPQKSEGAGKAGCPRHPRSCAEKRTRQITGTPAHPAFPARWFDGLFRALPGDEFRFVTVAGGLKICRSPVGPTPLRQLDTSIGCQNHTALPYAASPTHLSDKPACCSPKFMAETFKRRSSARRTIAHEQKPALQSRYAPDAAASTASHPASVTIAIRPSGGRDQIDISLIWDRRQGLFRKIRN